MQESKQDKYKQKVLQQLTKKSVSGFGNLMQASKGRQSGTSNSTLMNTNYKVITPLPQSNPDDMKYQTMQSSQLRSTGGDNFRGRNKSVFQQAPPSIIDNVGLLN